MVLVYMFLMFIGYTNFALIYCKRIPNRKPGSNVWFQNLLVGVYSKDRHEIISESIQIDNRIRVTDASFIIQSIYLYYLTLNINHRTCSDTTHLFEHEQIKFTRK